MKKKQVLAALILSAVFAFGLWGCDDSDSTSDWGMYYKDVDGDFYSDGASQETNAPPEGYYLASNLTSTSGDCDDDAPGINPGAEEVCGDGVDNNCDGNIDEGCGEAGNPPEFAGIGLAAASNDDSAFLAWTPSEDAATYRVYYSTTPDFEPSAGVLYDEIAGATEVEVDGLASNTDYYFLVLAVDADGNASQERDYKTVKTAETHVTLKESVTLVKPEEEGIAPPTADRDNGEYVFEAAAAEQMAAGDIIAGEDSEGNGYLRRVESVTIENGQTILQTTQASLDDVIAPLKLDTVVTLREEDAGSGITKRSFARSTTGGPVVTRRAASTGGSLRVEQTTYVATNESVGSGPKVRALRPRRMVSVTDPTGRLKLIAEDDRKIRPTSNLKIPVKAYLIDKDGQMITEQGKVPHVEFVGLTHPEVPDTAVGDVQMNYGAYFYEEDWVLHWIVEPEHISDKPYTATFRATVTNTDLTTEISVDIYVQDEAKYSTDFGTFDTEQEAGVNVDFSFEPDLRTSIDTGVFGGVKEGEIVATGDFSASIEAYYNFSAEASIEKEKEFFKKTWRLKYTLGPAPVWQNITFTLTGKMTAEAQAAISASAFAGLSTHLEFGIRYNPDTEEWELVKGADFDKELTFNLGVEGSVFAELRLIPQIDVTFYEVATGSFFLEPYLAGRAEAEWITDGDMLRQIVISQYQMKEMRAWIGIEGFFAADLSVWKFELWRMDKKSLFDFQYDLFNLPTISIEGEPPDGEEASYLLTALVEDGANNPFDRESASWNAYPEGRFTDMTVAEDPQDPNKTTFTAKFLANQADSYRIFFSGNSRFGVLTRQYADIETQIDADGLQGVPSLTELNPSDGEILVSWEADPETEEEAVFTLYMAEEPGVTPDNCISLTGGAVFEEVESPFTLTDLTNGVDYYMVVTATDSTGESEPSEEKTAAPTAEALPAAPTNLTATGGDGTVTLSWEAVENADSYIIYYSLTPGVSADANEGILTTNELSYAHEGLTNDQAYYYVVAAVSVAGRGPASTEASATPQTGAGAPDSPTGVTATGGNGNVTLFWNSANDAASYNVYMAEESGVNSANYNGLQGGQRIPGVDSPYSVNGLANDATYYFVVTSVGADGVESHPESVEVNASPIAPTMGDTITDDSNLGMTFAEIPAGTFVMGSPEGEPGIWEGERPHHLVTLTTDFYIMTTEVTQDQWQTVMGSNPSIFSDCGGDCPVENVSWEDVQDFISALNAMENKEYRLPTEAEWEYAARALSATAFANGGITKTECEIDPNLDAMGWYCGNSGYKTHPAAQKQPNGWGLHDMHGNVGEWCQDGYGAYPSDAQTDPLGPVEDARRVFRGGGFLNYAQHCRSASRDRFDSSMTDNGIGFRLAISAD